MIDGSMATGNLDIASVIFSELIFFQPIIQQDTSAAADRQKVFFSWNVSNENVPGVFYVLNGSLRYQSDLVDTEIGPNFFFLQILEKINLTLRGIQVNDFSTFPKCIFITMFALKWHL